MCTCYKKSSSIENLLFISLRYYYIIMDCFTNYMVLHCFSRLGHHTPYNPARLHEHCKAWVRQGTLPQMNTYLYLLSTKTPVDHFLAIVIWNVLFFFINMISRIRTHNSKQNMQNFIVKMIIFHNITTWAWISLNIKNWTHTRYPNGFEYIQKIIVLTMPEDSNSNSL